MKNEAQVQVIACTLDDEEFRARRAFFREQLLSSATSVEKIGAGGIRMIFPESRELRSMVETFVSLEQQCCGFLTFAVTDDGRGTVLAITGPPEAKDAMDRLIKSIEANDS